MFVKYTLKTSFEIEMALDTPRTHLHTITFVSAGAALLAVIGYLLMKSDSKKPRRKSSVDKNELLIDTAVNAINSSQDTIECIKEKLNCLEVELDKTKSIGKFGVNLESFF